MASAELRAMRLLLLQTVSPGPIVYRDRQNLKRHIAKMALAQGLTPTPKLTGDL